MNEREAIDLLKHYRHRYANFLQLIISYAQLGKLDVVQEKAADLIKIMGEDRRFHNLPLPKTIVTILQLNSEKSGLEWTPIVDCEKSPITDDQQVSEIINEIHQHINEQTMNLSVYHGTITFQQKKSEPFKLLFVCEGNFQEKNQTIAALEKIDRIEIEEATNEKLSFNWTAHE